MSLPDLYDRVRSGVLHIIFLVGGVRTASGSAFVVGDLVVTNNHVFRGPTTADVLIRFADSDPGRLEDGVRLTGQDFASRLVSGSDENHYDFAILKIPEVLQRAQYQFTFADPRQATVGMEVAFLGYPLDHLNLVLHRGTISSIYQSGSERILQLDASVNASNSGGPALILDTAEVTGIITRKATGLTTGFAGLIASFEANIHALELAKQRGGGVLIAGVDPMEGILLGQRQLLRIAREMERSANVGIGYAFAIDHVAGESCFDRP